MIPGCAASFNFLPHCPLQALVNKYSTAVNNQKSKVSQLEQDKINLSDDISSLKDKVEGLRTAP